MTRTSDLRLKWLLLLALFFGSLAFTGCSDSDVDEANDPSDEQEYQGVPIVIYDTDIGSSTDDLFALGILYHMAHTEKCKLIGGIVCRMGEEYVRLADILNTYNGFGDLPLGVERHGVEDPREYIPYAGIADLKREDGSPMFRRSIQDYSTLPDGWRLYRKLLAQQPDHSVEICAIGFMSTVVQLLKSEPDEYSSLNGIDLVKKKVHGLYVMGGKFGEEGNNSVGYNFGHKTAVDFSISMLEIWPQSVPVYFSPSLPGDYLDYPSDDVIKDLDWIEVNPIKQVYLNYNCNTGQRMWDVYPVMMALMDKRPFLGDMTPGFVHINKIGTEGEGEDVYEMVFEPNDLGYCYYQVLEDEARRAYHLQYVKDNNTNERIVGPYIFPDPPGPLERGR